VIGGGRLERQTQLKEEDNIINKWAQVDVNTLYSLLNNNTVKLTPCSISNPDPGNQRLRVVGQFWAKYSPVFPTEFIIIIIIIIIYH
jgi:hypothetical protein